ncbi:MAG: DegT/DnrJ/EryC1/StrS family aminotransferase [Phycisphaerae bacterium]|nr:DegT/DnrJ/EryC1/StrS family aminotransferase [Phycisphaerae bacterium]
MKVPFVDLQTQYKSLRDEVLPALEKVMSRAAFILGDEVSDFEKAFASFCGVSECVSVASGCSALLCAIKALGIGPGDEVITPANTYIATVLAISAAGATPVLVDCLEDTYELDPAAVRAAVTKKTKAVIPVHLYGQAADMDAILALAREHGLKVIEDAAQAHGATYKGKPCGSLGDVGCFSFYPGKNLGAYGDGGAITTNDPAVADYVRKYRNYGQTKKYYHDVVGWNDRLDTVQAAVLSVKLKHLAGWNAARRAHAEAYGERLKELPVVLPKVAEGNEPIYHLFVIRHPKRDVMLKELGEKGVSCGIHYPIPCHLQKAYSGLGYGKGSFPVAERTAPELLSLPMFPELSDEQIDYVCACIREFISSHGA